MADDDNEFGYSPLPGGGGYDDYIQYLDDVKTSRAGYFSRHGHSGDRRFIKEIGEYVTPRSNSWEDYSAAVQVNGLDFDMDACLFDRAVAASSHISGLYNSKNRQYENYAPLRHNLAVLRNFVLNHIYGETVDEDEARDPRKLNYVAQIGQQVGALLRHGAHPVFSGPFSPGVQPDTANSLYDGAVAIYEKLLSAQNRSALFAPVSFVMHLFSRHYEDRRWKLPPIEITPFGRLNYFAPPPSDVIAAGDMLTAGSAFALADRQPDQFPNASAALPVLDAVDMRFTDVAPTPYRSVESLSQPIKTQAIAIARDILDKLKLQFSNTPLMAMLDQNSGHFGATMNDLNTVIAIYQDHFARARQMDPSLEEDPRIHAANDAIGFIGAQIRLKALDRAEIIGDEPTAMQIREELSQMPAHWLNPNSYTSSTVLQGLEQGLLMVLATIQSVGQDAPGQVELGLMLQATYQDPLQQQLRMASLAQDEAMQQQATERRNAFQAALSHQKTSRTGAAISDTPSSGHKHKAAFSAGATGMPPAASLPAAAMSGNTMSALLNQNNVDISRMQSAINAPTSGNPNPAAPGNIQQVIAHHTRTGQTTQARQQQREGQRQQRRGETERQQARAERQAQRARENEQTKNTTPTAAQRDDELPPLSPQPRRDRSAGRT